MNFFLELGIFLIGVSAIVLCTARYQNKLAKKSKFMEMKCKYLSQSLDSLNEIEVRLLECVVRQMDTCLAKANPDDRRKNANMVIKEISSIIHMF